MKALMMSMEEVAAFLGVNKSTVSRWKSLDKTFPPALREGNRLLWKSDGIKAWAVKNGRDIRLFQEDIDSEDKSVEWQTPEDLTQKLRSEYLTVILQDLDAVKRKVEEFQAIFCPSSD